MNELLRWGISIARYVNELLRWGNSQVCGCAVQMGDC